MRLLTLANVYCLFISHRFMAYQLCSDFFDGFYSELHGDDFCLQLSVQYAKKIQD
jgi:hypothetical protein